MPQNEYEARALIFLRAAREAREHGRVADAAMLEAEAIAAARRPPSAGGAGPDRIDQDDDVTQGATPVMGPGYMQDLQERMRAMRVTAADLSRQSGKSTSQLSRWFSGRATPTLANVEVLEAAFQALLAARMGAGRGA